MRLSVIKIDPGYDRRAVKGARIFLNGEELKDVYTADEEKGEVLLCKRDERDQLIRDGDGWATETLCGAVKIELARS